MKRQMTWNDVLTAALFAALVLAVWPANATEPKPTAPSQSQMQNQSAVADSSSVSGGGQASANLYDGSETRTLAIGTTSPTPLHDTPTCYLPAKGIKRVRQVLFGVVTLDSRLVRDDGCMVDLAAQREF